MNSLGDLGFDPSKFHLGILCRRKHDYGDGRSVRYIKNNECLECSRYRQALNRERRKQYCAENRDRINQYRRDRYQGNRQKFAQISKARYQKEREARLEYAKTYREQNRERLRLEAIEYRRANGEAIASRRKEERKTGKPKERQKLYYHTNKSRIRLVRSQHYFANKSRYRERERRRKANRRSVYQAPYSQEQLKYRFQQFQNSCAYCSSTNKKLTIDHFIALNVGGPEALNNLLPCCRSCNSSKGDRDAYQWYVQQSFYSKKRWQAILKVLGKTQATYSQIPLL